MNTKQTVPLLAALPALPALALAAPPLLLGAAIGLGLIWLFTDDEKKEAPKPVESGTIKPAPTKPATISPSPVMPAPVKPAPAKPAPVMPTLASPASVKPLAALPAAAAKPAPTPFTPPVKNAKKRITWEDLAEALEYGARSLTLGEAVLALQARGFGKTAAYKALSARSKFGDLIENTPDGLVEWKG